MRTFTKDELKEILRLHGMWLRGEKCGEKADLRYSNLSYSDLRGSNLSYSDLRYSNLSYSDLRGSNLSYSDLSYSDLRGSNLRGSVGQNNWIKTLGSDIWQIVYTFDCLQIGCENHAITEWWEFDDDRISRMDDQALEFWKRWKPILQAIIANNPAQATGKEGS